MLKSLKSDFFKNAGKLAIGTLLAQLIPILIQPVLRRIFTPEEFGLFAIYLSVIGMFSSVICLRYDQAIVPSKNTKDANNLIYLSALSAFSVSILLIVLSVVFKSKVLSYLNLSSENFFIVIIAFVGLFVTGVNRAMNLWLIREKEFNLSSLNKVYRRIAEGGVQLTFYKLFSYLSLFIGDVLGNFVSLVVSSFKYQKKREKFSFKEIKTIIKKYSDFPLRNAVPTFLNSFSLVIPVFFINNFFSKDVTGYFDLTKQMLALPISLISVSISQSVLEKVSDNIRNRKSIKNTFLTSFKLLSLLSSLGVLIVFFFGEELFVFVFGNQWFNSGKYSEILIFSFAIKFVVSPLSIILIALRQLKTVAIWQFLYFGMICSLYFLKDYDVIFFLKTLTLIDIVAYLVYIIIVFFKIKEYENKLHA